MIYDVLEELEGMAGKYGISMNQLAVKWLLSKDWVTCPILGGRRSEHFSPLYNLFDISIDDEDLLRIDEISQPFIYAPFENQGMVGGAAEQKNWW